MLAAKVQRQHRHPQFQTPVAVVLQYLAAKAPQIAASRSSAQLACKLSSQIKIDRPAVIGIDKAEVPHLLALIRVRDSWAGELEQRLAERVHGAEVHHRR